MKPVTRNFVLGLTSIGAIVGLVFLLMVFGELEPLLAHRYLLSFNCPNAAGLRAGSLIELNGVPIGRIERIANTDDPAYPVEITAVVDEGSVIPADVTAYATASLLGGSATLQLEGTRGDAGELPRDGQAVIRGPIRSRLMEDFTAEIDNRMEPLIAAMGDFQALAVNLNELVGSTGEPGPAGAASLRTAIDNANQLIVQITATLDEYTTLADTIRADARAALEDVTEVLDGLAVTLEDVGTLARRASEGDGTVARLLNDATLYESMVDATERLERALREIQLAAEKVKAEGVQVRF